MIRVSAMVIGAMLMAIPVAHAEVTAKDAQLMLKVIGFLNPPVSGAVPIAIVFDAANADSKKEADTLKGVLDAAQGGPIAPQATPYSVIYSAAPRRRAREHER